MNVKELSEKKDPFIAWMKCQGDLLEDMDLLQESLAREFEFLE